MTFAETLSRLYCRSEALDDRPGSWIIEPIIQLPEVAEENLKQWPFEEKSYTVDSGKAIEG